MPRDGKRDAVYYVLYSFFRAVRLGIVAVSIPFRHTALRNLDTV